MEKKILISEINRIRELMGGGHLISEAPASGNPVFEKLMEKTGLTLDKFGDAAGLAIVEKDFESFLSRNASAEYSRLVAKGTSVTEREVEDFLAKDADAITSLFKAIEEFDAKLIDEIGDWYTSSLLKTSAGFERAMTNAYTNGGPDRVIALLKKGGVYDPATERFWREWQPSGVPEFKKPSNLKPTGGPGTEGGAGTSSLKSSLESVEEYWSKEEPVKWKLFKQKVDSLKPTDEVRERLYADFDKMHDWSTSQLETAANDIVDKMTDRQLSYYGRVCKYLGINKLTRKGMFRGAGVVIGGSVLIGAIFIGKEIVKCGKSPGVCLKKMFGFLFDDEPEDKKKDGEDWNKYQIPDDVDNSSSNSSNNNSSSSSSTSSGDDEVIIDN